jgi:hypothetical protein
VIDLPSLLRSLAVRRPVFHSEADFQHEFAWEVRSQYPKISVRLERPLDDSLGATDIVLFDDSGAFGVELKFCSKATQLRCLNEDFRLKQHGAHPLRRYDICKDIQRMELFNSRYRRGSAVIALTNDSAYWTKQERQDVCDYAFRISENETLGGLLDWGVSASDGTKKGRATPIFLSGNYQMNWTQFSEVEGKCGRFQYLLVSVA